MEYTRELFESLECATVDKALEEFISERDKIMSLSENDAVRSAAFYAAFKRLSDEFIAEVRERVFPVINDGLWGYEVDYDNTALELSMVRYAEDIFIDNNGVEHPTYIREDYFSLYRKEAKLLSVDEYARHYAVDSKTVTQWIRRGKIRTAKKYGSAWMIPELSDMPVRGYTTALYHLDVDVRPLSDEYPFLLGIEHLYIQQDEDDKTKYYVRCYKKNDGSEESFHPVCVEEFSQNEKEKFEMGLIAHPRVKYTPNMRETLLPDYMRVNNVSWGGALSD